MMNCSVILDNYEWLRIQFYTSAERIVANSFSLAEHPFLRPASIGLTNNCRKDDNELNIPGLTNSERAYNSYY